MIKLRETPDSTIRVAPVFYTAVRRVVDVRPEEVRILYTGSLLCQCFVDACEADSTVLCVGRAAIVRVPFFVLREYLCPASTLKNTMCVCKLP